MSDEKWKFTVGELRAHMDGLPDDMELILQGGITFYRFNERGENLIQMEFNEPFELVPCADL